jgi:phosphoserine phosphatase RsbU/P
MALKGGTEMAGDDTVLPSAVGRSNTRSKVLLVDDEPGIINAVRRVLRKEDFEIVSTQEPQEALRLMAQDDFAVVISDQRMPAMEGTELLEQARHLAPDTVRIILTGYVDIEAAIEAINRGAVFRFITKPWDDEDLRSTIRQAVAQYELFGENRRLQRLAEEQNRALVQLNRDLEKVHEDEVKNAYRIQQSLLQSQEFPQVEGIEIATLSIPSQQIDGDFYDLLQLGQRCIDIMVGDVMGKGVPAAILGAATKNQFLRATAHALSQAQDGLTPAPEEIVGLVHNELTHRLIELESFVTICYGRFDLAACRLALVDCGHTKTIHFKAKDAVCVLLEGHNMPLGFSAKETYRQLEADFAAGDVFFFYSDGLSEAQDAAGELYGGERLASLLAANANLAPSELVARIHQNVVAFSGSEVFADDFTCVVAKIG